MCKPFFTPWSPWLAKSFCSDFSRPVWDWAVFLP